MDKEPGGLWSIESQSRTTEQLTDTHTQLVLENWLESVLYE